MKYYDEVLSYFRVSKKGDKTSQAFCPYHNGGKERKPSLTISRGRDNRALLFCHVCGKENTEQIINAVGLTWSDILPDREVKKNKKTVKQFAEYAGKQSEFSGRRFIKQYDYYTTGGKYCFTKCRILEADGRKTFKYCRTDNYGFVSEYSVKDRQGYKALYPFDQIEKAKQDNNIILYCEGEKDAENAIRDGFHAVTAGSANDWTANLTDHFIGLQVVVIPDQDKAGLESALKIVLDLTARNELGDIKIDVRGLMWPDTFTTVKGDYSDFIETFENRQQGINAFKELIENATFPPFFADYVKNTVCRFSDNPNEDLRPNLLDFHHLNNKGEPVRVFDVKILEYLIKDNNIKILGKTPYIYNNGVFVPDLSGARLKTMISELIFPEFIRYQTIKRIYDLILSTYSIQVTSKQLNNYPPHWINFKNGFYDPIEKKMIPHDRKYLAVNQIPHEFHPDVIPSGPTIDSWLDFITPDPGNREMLLQYCGYCMTRDISQQKFLILLGVGGSGKSTLIRLLESAIGASNISHVSLKDISARFQNYSLLGKLVNSCADLEIDALKDSATFKKLTGEDPIQTEAKGQQPIDFYNYARMIFSTNEIPSILHERSDAFYRRLMILPMDKKPIKKDPRLFEKLEAEIDHFIFLCVMAVSRMYKKSVIAESDTSAELVREAWANSDSVQAFLNECCEIDNKLVLSHSIRREDLYSWYQMYCVFSDRTALKRTAFYKAMRTKNFKDSKSDSYFRFKGISVNVDSISALADEISPNLGQKIRENPFDPRGVRSAI